ncbi:MAG: threonylcarbamoyl-AMP synthase [Clostridia bacterium]|nr:threonylcarbamoyl-AMP synthase [Clostridia bacterium]
MITEIVKLSEATESAERYGTAFTLSPEDDAKIKSCAEIIKRGGLVVFPTETVYGLGGDATSPTAASKIYEAKGRPSDNPLIIHVSCPEEAEKYAYTTELYYRLAEAFMPGPLTVILDAKDSVPSKTRGGLSTVAVRCPTDAVARRLIELSGVPIAAPSANLSGSPSPTRAKHVIDDMLGRVDAIIDGGECEFGLESTIVKINSDDTLTLLRPGKITPTELEKIAPVTVADAVVDKLKEGEVAISPGMKYRHYAPSSPVVLLDGNLDKCLNYIEKTGQNNQAFICYTDEAEAILKRLPSLTLYPIGAREDLFTQAHLLFSILREADTKNHSCIYAHLPKREGIGLALYNRLIRAAAHTIINL